MLRTKHLPLSVFLLLGLIDPSSSHANPLTNSSRDAIIQKQMDCVSHSLNNTAIGWQDVCDIPEASSQSPADKTEAVNRQLDEVASKDEFPGVEQDAGKVFSNTGEPDRQSIKGMLRQISNPDVEGTIVKKTSSNIKTRVHNFDLGTEIFYYRFVMPHVIVGSQEGRWRDTGPMEGFYANYDYRPVMGNILNNPLINVYSLQARYATSHGIGFNGQDQGTLRHEHNDVMEFRGLLGKDYAMGQDVMVTPYFGYGYRYLDENNEGRETSAAYPMNVRKSHYYYLPLGGNVAFSMTNNWEMDLNAEYDIFLTGMQKNYYSNWNQFFPGQGYPDVSYRQSHGGFGLRGSVKIIKKGPIFDFYVEPYFRFWNIDNSKTIIWSDGSAVGEPANNTTEIGSKFGVQF